MNEYQSDYKALTPKLFIELDERVKKMWYAPNPELGKIIANDLLARIKHLHDEKYILPVKYGMMAYHYGDWIMTKELPAHLKNLAK